MQIRTPAHDRRKGPGTITFNSKDPVRPLDLGIGVTLSAKPRKSRSYYSELPRGRRVMSNGSGRNGNDNTQKAADQSGTNALLSLHLALCQASYPVR
jgi:hypothetical protein